MDAYERSTVLLEYARSLADQSRRYARRADTLAEEAQRVLIVAEQVRASAASVPGDQPCIEAER